jgi:hypothetical protein
VLSSRDRRELRNFERFLRFRRTHLATMMTRPRWQKYLNLTPQEAWKYAKLQRAQGSSK